MGEWAKNEKKNPTAKSKAQQRQKKHTHTNGSFVFFQLEQTLAADSLFRALHFQFGFVFD